MTTSNRKNIVNIDDTRFIFQTNFSGDPARDRFGSNRRVFNIVIPDPMQAQALRDVGVNVRETRPNPNRVYEGEFRPTNYVKVNVNMESDYPPHIYWISPEGNRTECTVAMLSQLDYIRVKKVDCQCKLYKSFRHPEIMSLYADIVYIYQDLDYDPYYQRYMNEFHNSTPAVTSNDSEDVPF